MSEPVSSDMQALIQARLHDIERQENLKVLFAIESGSRAWGFHSPDSDFDVRFVYARPLDWHFKLGKKRDVVEYPIDDELDISGWELSKALSLMVGSNAVIAEWLQSPVIYLSDAPVVKKLDEFARRVLDRKSVTWHYLSLIRRQQSRLEGPDGVRLKRFFYILRPILALRWMRLHDQAMPPMDMAKLLDGCGLKPAELAAVHDLIEQKKAALERAAGIVPNRLLTDLVMAEIETTEAWLKTASSPDRADFWREAEALHKDISLGLVE